MAAKELSDQMIDLFADNEHGGFFLTGSDGEELIARTKPAYDGAIPSGNSVAALALLKLGLLTMNQRYTEHAGKTLETFSQQLERSPAASSAMLTALDFQLGPTQEIVIAGKASAADTRQMLKAVRKRFLPNAIVLLHDQHNGSEIAKIVPFLKNQIAMNGKATAYVCQNYVCNWPVNKLTDLEKTLDKISPAQKNN